MSPKCNHSVLIRGRHVTEENVMQRYYRERFECHTTSLGDGGRCHELRNASNAALEAKIGKTD